MSDAPFHTREQFEKAIGRLIKEADAQNRGEDLDRVVSHLQQAPGGVSRLASLLLLVDEDVRPALKSHVDAYKRFCAQKKHDGGDEAVMKVLLDVYRGYRH